jgi:hypothetical protein
MEWRRYKHGGEMAHVLDSPRFSGWHGGSFLSPSAYWGVPRSATE